MKDGDVVAQVGKYKLYSSELESYIPKGISSEDSTILAMRYINSWASDLLFLNIAEEELSKDEKDVSAELEVYRRSLLKYRYEQKFVNQRLDTLITDDEIEKYYDSHIENFRLEAPIVKARFITIAESSPSLGAIRRILASNDTEELSHTDSLVFSSALRYTDYGGKWIEAGTLARDFGTDYATVVSALKKNYVELPDGKGNLCIAYIPEIMMAGATGPVEYYEERIKDVILSTRKQILLTGLERDLLEKARGQKNFEIY